MKVAGRKNDGAWYRANLLIKSLSDTEKSSLALTIGNMSTIENFLAAIQAFYTDAGLTGDPNYPSSSSQLATAYSTHGIPRQAWFGTLSYDTYTRSGTSGDYTYTPDNRDAAFAFGKEIRKVMRNFGFARRQAKDLTNVAPRNEGNPGGVADATQGT